jgi:hypothetical protein
MLPLLEMIACDWELPCTIVPSAAAASKYDRVLLARTGERQQRARQVPQYSRGHI